MLEWIVERVNGRADAVASPFGTMPRHQDINWTGLDFGAEDFNGIMDIDRAAARQETESQTELFERFGDRLPGALEAERRALVARLDQGDEIWRIAADR